jgi:LPXTG-site transpeptidase (sortase) family protein
MRSPYQRQAGLRLRWWQFLLLLAGVVLIVFGWDRLSHPETSSAPPAPAPLMTPTMPEHLTSADVLPTPTIDPLDVPRTISFAGARTTARIINAARTVDSWETRYLGDSVGHLEGTAWFDDPGGNVVLVGHVTDYLGRDGPFAYLFEAEVGDEITLTEGDVQRPYRVTAVERAQPEDVFYVAQDGVPRLTLITCDDWDYEAQTYNQRVVLIAEPIEAP